jgi:peroxiredoxin
MNKRMLQRKGVLFAAFLLVSRLDWVGVVGAVEVGEKAPEFKLPATTGLDVALSDFRGKKWVLIEFYSADFAPA